MVQKLTETIGFSIYLIVTIYMSYYLLNQSKGRDHYKLMGFTGIVIFLMAGSEMLTRIYALLTSDIVESVSLVGQGKKVHWVLVFVVGILLYEVYKARFKKRRNANADRLLYGLAFVGILLSLFRANQWDALFPPKGYGFLRTLPQLLLYGMLAFLFYGDGKSNRSGNFMINGGLLGVNVICSLILVFWGGSIATYNVWQIIRALTYLIMLALAFKELRNENLLSRF